MATGVHHRRGGAAAAAAAGEHGVAGRRTSDAPADVSSWRVDEDGEPTESKPLLQVALRGSATAESASWFRALLRWKPSDLNDALRRHAVVASGMFADIAGQQLSDARAFASSPARAAVLSTKIDPEGTYHDESVKRLEATSAFSLGFENLSAELMASHAKAGIRLEHRVEAALAAACSNARKARMLLEALFSEYEVITRTMGEEYEELLRKRIKAVMNVKYEPPDAAIQGWLPLEHRPYAFTPLNMQIRVRARPSDAILDMITTRTLAAIPMAKDSGDNVSGALSLRGALHQLLDPAKSCDHTYNITIKADSAIGWVWLEQTASKAGASLTIVLKK